MTKVIMHGCNGKMGQVITGLIAQDGDVEIVAGIDTYDEKKNDYPVYKTIRECQIAADVVIDFSNAKAVDELLNYCGEKKLPLVLCTTGLSEDQLAKVTETSKETAILKSANMSLGINTLMDLLQTAIKKLAPAGFDVEIVEKHHNQKLDAPSGTALALADAMNEAMDNTYSYKLDRSSERKKRDAKEIGIHILSSFLSQSIFHVLPLHCLLLLLPLQILHPDKIDISHQQLNMDEVQPCNCTI